MLVKDGIESRVLTHKGIDLNYWRDGQEDTYTLRTTIVSIVVVFTEDF